MLLFYDIYGHSVCIKNGHMSITTKVPFNSTLMTTYSWSLHADAVATLLSVSLRNLFIVVMWSAKKQPAWYVMNRKMRHVSFNGEIHTLVINGTEFKSWRSFQHEALVSKVTDSSLSQKLVMCDLSTFQCYLVFVCLCYSNNKNTRGA